MQAPIKLGNHEYVVVPQRHRYLQEKLGTAFVALGSMDGAAGADMLGGITSQAYSLLKVFIPNLMPEFEFQGYATQAAYEAGEYTEEGDNSPTPDQIINAFEQAMKVNRLDLVKHLRKVVGEDFLMAQMRVAIGTATQRALETSPTSASESGESASTSSTPSSPTSPPNGDSLSLASTSS